MKLSQVLKTARENKGLSLQRTAVTLGFTPDEYNEIEAGQSPVEDWGPRLWRIALVLQVPPERLVSGTGRGAGAKGGQVGTLIHRHRKLRGVAVASMARSLAISSQAYEEIEAGRSPLEEYGPILLRFSELIGLRHLQSLLAPLGSTRGKQ